MPSFASLKIGTRFEWRDAVWEKCDDMGAVLIKQYVPAGEPVRPIHDAPTVAAVRVLQRIAAERHEE